MDFSDNQAGGFAINNVNIHVTDSTINVSDNLGNACNSGYWIVDGSTITMNGNRGGHALSCIGFEMTDSTLETLHNGYAGIYIQSRDSSLTRCTVDLRCNGERLLSYTAGDLWLNGHTLTVDGGTSQAQPGSVWLGGVGRVGAVSVTSGTIVAHDLSGHSVDNLKSNCSPVLDQSALALNGEEDGHTLLLDPFMTSDYARGNGESTAGSNDVDLFEDDRVDDPADILGAGVAKIGTLTDAQLSHHRYDWTAGEVRYEATEAAYGALAYPCADVCGDYIGQTGSHPNSFDCAGTYVYAPLAGLAFAGEPPLPEYMNEPPKKRDEPVLNRYMLSQILWMGAFTVTLCVLFLKLPVFKTWFRYANDPIYLMTAFFALFIFTGIFLPVIAIIFIGAFKPDIFIANLTTGADPSLAFVDQVQTAMMVTIWVFIGIEGAVAISGRAKKAKDVGKATIIAFICVLTLYLTVSILSMGVMPLSELANLENPALAYVMQAAVGDWGAVLINFAVSLSLIGAMLGYTVLASESPFEAAEEGVFIRAFAKTNAKGAPVVTLVVTNIIIELFLITWLFTDSTYQFFYTLSAGMILLPYLLSAAYFAKVAFKEPDAFKGRLNGPILMWRILGCVGVVYSLFLSWAAGVLGVILMCLLYVPGILMYIWGKRERGEKYFQSTLDKVVVFIILAAAVASIVLVVTGQVIL